MKQDFRKKISTMYISLGLCLALVFGSFLPVASVTFADDGAGDAITPETKVAAYCQNTDTLTWNKVIFDSKHTDPFQLLWFQKDANADYENINSFSYKAADGVVNMEKQFWAADLYPIYVYPLKAGTTNLTVTTPAGATIDVPITVDSSYFSSALKKNSYIYLSKGGNDYDNKILYGEKSYKGETLPYAKVTLKIKGKSYTTTANKRGSFNIKIKSIYKIGTKAKVTYSRGGKSYTKNFKVKKWSSAYYIGHTKAKKVKTKGNKKIYKYKLKLNAYSLHKGDMVKVKLKGKTFKKKLTKNNPSTVYVTVPKVKKGTKFKVTVINKYKQKMYSKKFKI